MVKCLLYIHTIEGANEAHPFSYVAMVLLVYLPTPSERKL